MLAACGGSTGATTSASSNSAGNSSAQHAQVAAGAAASSSNASSTSKGAGPALDIGTNYLIKTLNVSLNVNDTRSAANEIQQRISTIDPRATSAGVNYNQEGANLYGVTMTFSVQASLYPQIYTYLRDYKGHAGQLTNFQETVQNVSNDYVDTQSRITTYQDERDRLLTLLKQAQKISDIVTIEQRLSDVEQNLESTEAHLKLLNSQVTFYNVTVQLQPLSLAVPAPQRAQPWTIGQTFTAAWSAVASLGQALLTVLIWLVTFCVYIIPLGLLIWFVIRWQRRRGISFGSPTKSTPAS
jgi:Uncharacterized iron-regulated membrane protein